MNSNTLSNFEIFIHHGPRVTSLIESHKKCLLMNSVPKEMPIVSVKVTFDPIFSFVLPETSLLQLSRKFEVSEIKGPKHMSKGLDAMSDTCKICSFVSIFGK